MKDNFNHLIEKVEEPTEDLVEKECLIDKITEVNSSDEVDSESSR